MRRVAPDGATIVLEDPRSSAPGSVRARGATRRWRSPPACSTRGAERGTQSATTQVPPAASMAALAAPEKAWAWTVSGLVISPLARILTGMSLRVPRPLATQRLERHLGARVEARLEVLQVDRLRVRAERLERHRLLHVRAAQLAHPHVDRHLAALEAGAVLGARARAVALLAAAGGLAGARALAAADALARLAAARGGLQRVQPDARLSASRPGRPSVLLDLHEMADAVEHAARLRRVLDLDRLADPAQAERAQRVELALGRAVLAT